MSAKIRKYFDLSEEYSNPINEVRTGNASVEQGTDVLNNFTLNSERYFVSKEVSSSEKSGLVYPLPSIHKFQLFGDDIKSFYLIFDRQNGVCPDRISMNWIKNDYSEKLTPTAYYVTDISEAGGDTYTKTEVQNVGITDIFQANVSESPENNTGIKYYYTLTTNYLASYADIVSISYSLPFISTKKTWRIIPNGYYVQLEFYSNEELNTIQSVLNIDLQITKTFTTKYNWAVDIETNYYYVNFSKSSYTINGINFPYAKKEVYNLNGHFAIRFYSNDYEPPYLSKEELANVEITISSPSETITVGLSQTGYIWYVDKGYLSSVDMYGKYQCVEITISRLNKPSVPLVIQGIFDRFEIDVDLTNMLSLEAKRADRENFNLPSYGIIANSAKIEFNDVFEMIKYYAKEKYLSGLIARIYINNTLAKYQEQIGLYNVVDIDFDEDNKTSSIDLVDNLVEWQDIEIPAMVYDLSQDNGLSNNILYGYNATGAGLSNGGMSLLELYSELKSSTPSKYMMRDNPNTTKETSAYLGYAKIKFPYMAKGTLWKAWQKFCEVSQCHIYKGRDGRTEILYLDGN